MRAKIIFAMLFIASGLWAQENYMALSFGVSNPMGDFAATESLSSSGYARTGFMADYSGAYFLLDYVAVGGNLKFTQQSIEAGLVEDELVGLLPPDVVESVSRFEIGYWADVSIAVGPQLTLPLGIISIDAYFFPGLHIITPPKMYVEGVFEGEPYYTVLSSQKARFGFESGLALRLNLGESTGIRIFGSYLQSSSTGTVSGTGDNNTQTGSIELKRKLQMINAGIGLIYKI